MKRITAWLGILLMGMTVLTSCLGDDDSTTSTTYSDAAIVQFTLGSMNRYTSAKSTKTGNDTIIKTTVSGSTYRMTIDQLSGAIYNAVELPVGTDVAHVVCTVNAKNYGTVTVKSTISDTLRMYSSTDSIDFTQPRTFRVFSANGMFFRDYTVSLRVSSTSDATHQWQLTATNAEWAQLDGKRLVAGADSVTLQPADSIIGTTQHEWIAMGTDGHLMASADHGLTWQQEQLDDAEELLPQPGTAVMVSWPYASANDTDYLLMVGQPRQPEAEGMRVWRKISNHSGGGQWVYMPLNDNNYYPLPLLTQFTMAYHNGVVLALGSDMVMRQSRDQGISWRTATDYALPETLTGTAARMATDGQGRLWLLTDTGQLWRCDE